MSTLNFKDFLTSGALLETGDGKVLVAVGPFKKASFSEVVGSEFDRFLYRPNFWDFLHESRDSGVSRFYAAKSEFLIDREDFIGLIYGLKATKPPIDWKDVQETGFREQFRWTQRQISETHLRKAVPIICQEGAVTLSHEHKVWMLKNLFETEGFGRVYAFFDDTVSVIGKTPEVLLTWDAESAVAGTVALAGTLARSSTARTEILRDAKIADEHKIVVDDIKEKLGDFKTNVSSTYAQELKHLVHLRTDINFGTGSLLQVLTAVRQLHPTAAMGIYPNEKSALLQLADFEIQKERGAFAAPFGFVSNRAVDLIVSIRNLIADGQLVRLYSGCGVTGQSVYDAELQELENKRNSVKKMLGLERD